MKVKVKPRPELLRGKIGDIVYCYHPHQGIVTARRYVYPTLTAQNSSIASVNTNLLAIKPSEGYQRDLRAYIRSYNSTPEGELKPIRSWTNLYIKLMYALAKSIPDIDLRILTREDIYERDLPCISVKRAVEGGLLMKVREWERFTTEI